jgi:hypothetical protein
MNGEACNCVFRGAAWTAGVALVWPVLALCFSGPWPDSGRWVIHSATWGFDHLCILPFAVGLFAAAVNRDVFRLAAWDRVRRRRAYALLLLFAAVAVGLAVYDANQPSLQPVYLKDGERDRAYAFERVARQEGIDQAEKISGVTKDEYLRLVGGEQGSTRTILNAGNVLGVVSFILNVLFGLFLAVFFWVLVVGQFGGAATWYDELLLSFALLGLWFPCRVYASWYIHHFVSANWLETYQLFAVLVIVYLAAGGFFLLRRLRDAEQPSRVIAVGLLVVPVVLAAVKVVKPEFFGQVAAAVEHLGWLPALAIGLVILTLMAALARWLCCPPVTAATGTNQPPPRQ